MESFPVCAHIDLTWIVQAYANPTISDCDVKKTYLTNKFVRGIDFTIKSKKTEKIIG